MMIDLNQTCYAKLPIVDFRKNELRKAVVSFTPLEIMPPAPSGPGALPPGQKPLWGGAWAGGCSGVTFQINSACLPRPRSGPGPVGRAGFNSPLEFLTGFT